MKIKIYLLSVVGSTTLLNVSAQRKRPIATIPFHWTTNQFILNNSQKKFIDSVYAVIPNGESIKFTMLDDEEQQMKEFDRAQLSFKRTESFINHVYSKNISRDEYYAEMVPFTTPHTVRSPDLNSYYYRGFMAKKALTSFIFLRPKVNPSAKTSYRFDATYNKEEQKFAMDSKKKMNVVLASGTNITIPANALMYKNGKPCDCDQIDVSVAEYGDLAAMAIKGMSTTSGGKKLQTGGMWHVGVSCNGEELILKPGMHYDINVAREGEVKKMKVFTGFVNKNGSLDWREEKDGRVFTASLSSVRGEIQGEKTINNLQVKSQDIVNRENTEELNVNSDYRNVNESNLNYDKNWKKKRLNNMNQGGFGIMSYEGKDSLKSYDLQLNDFGWINCDAFDEDQKLTDVVIGGDFPKFANVMLVYGKRKSVLPGYLCTDGKSIQFSNVAENETAVLVAFHKDEKGNITKFVKVINPANEKNINVKMSNSTADDVQREIKSKLSDI